MKKLFMLLSILWILIGLVSAQNPSVTQMNSNKFAFEAPVCGNSSCSDNLTFWTNFTTKILPSMDGIGGTIPWSVVDSCATVSPFTQQPCGYGQANPEPYYNWTAIDTDLMYYINNVTNWGTTACNGHACKIMIVIEPEQDSVGLNSFTPEYIFSSTWATTLGVPDQDVMACNPWQGGSTGWAAGVPYTGTFSASDFVTWNAAGGTVISGSDITFTGGAFPMTRTNANYSGFPVVYETPIVTGYEKLVSAFVKHYSSSGSGSGPTIATYLDHLHVGFALGGEDYPYCAEDGSGNPKWPGPQGEALQPIGYSDQNYFNYHSTIINYLASLSPSWKTNTSSPWVVSSHDGPPNNANQAYADDVATKASASGVVGFGMQGLANANITSYNSNPATVNADWVNNFARYPNVTHHLQNLTNGTFPLGTAYGISSISSGGTVTCAQSGCTNYCSDDYNIYIGGSSTSAANGQWILKSGGSCSSASTNVVINSYTGGACASNCGTLFGPAYMPLTYPFAQKHGATEIEFHECELDYMFGTTSTSSPEGPCNGLSGPDTTWSSPFIGVPTLFPVQLSSTPPKTPTPSGCNFYRSLTTGGPYVLVNWTAVPYQSGRCTYTDYNVWTNTYYYVSTHIVGGQESGTSSQVTQVVP